MLLEGLGQLKNPVTSSGIKPATFQLVARCLNQLRYRLPPFYLCASLFDDPVSMQIA
jgi:hypothetical protein